MEKEQDVVKFRPEVRYNKFANGTKCGYDNEPFRDKEGDFYHLLPETPRIPSSKDLPCRVTPDEHYTIEARFHSPILNLHYVASPFGNPDHAIDEGDIDMAISPERTPEIQRIFGPHFDAQRTMRNSSYNGEVIPGDISTRDLLQDLLREGTVVGLNLSPGELFERLKANQGLGYDGPLRNCDTRRKGFYKEYAFDIERMGFFCPDMMGNTLSQSTIYETDSSWTYGFGGCCTRHRITTRAESNGFLSIPREDFVKMGLPKTLYLEPTKDTFGEP